MTTAARRHILRWLAPIAVGVALLLAWEGAVIHWNVPVYLVPSPRSIGAVLVRDWSLLSDALWVTLHVALVALLLAFAIGTALAFLFIQTNWHRAYFLPVGQEGGQCSRRLHGRA